MIAKTIRRVTVWIIAVFIFISTIGVGFSLGFQYVLSQNERFSNFETDTVRVEADTPGAVMIVIPRGSDTSDIAEILARENVIKNRLAFIFLSTLNGFNGEYRAGTHFVKDDMTYDEIMYLLCLEPQTVRVTFREGLTYSEVKQTLHDAGVLFDEDSLDNMINNPSLFLDYEFVTQIPGDSPRDWLLQGYLFPDTYQFDMNTDEEAIIRTFLSNTQRKLIPELYARAEHLGLTMDEVITLASIIEWESGRLDEMDLVASVFHNRLNATDHTTGNRLESDSTINYIRKERGLEPVMRASDEDLEIQNPYNTYIFEGLPPGPICSPGMDAIRAALWPSRTGYYYFVSKNDNTGSSAFARTLSEHNANVARYLE